jgi:AcrR family transcriptional regulator
MAKLSPDTPTELRPRLEPIQARAQRSRRKILDAAHALLKAHGVHQLTTVAIAEASGVSVGALYRFFPNKESIICQLYEEKLVEIRRMGVANRPDATLPWRPFFEGYFKALKAGEREVDFDFSLADAIFMLPQLWAIDLRHGMILADQLAADMKQMGSPWSPPALFDLAINLYALDSSVWMYWRYSQRYPVLAIDRAIEASLGMMRPAMEGEAEPRALGISRERLLATLAD